MNIRTLFPAAALAAGVTLALSAPLAAAAHVSVNPNQAEAGSDALIAFHVPNESATASTASVTVTFPADTPFGFVDYVPVAGWSVAVTSDTLDTPIVTEHGEITEAVTSVTWTAQPGNEIAEGQVQVFPLSVGPVPDTGSIAFPVEQTYTDGTIVGWTEVGGEGENQAPVLYINDAPVDHHHEGAEEPTVTTDEHANHAGHTETAATTEATGSDDVLARVLGIGALVLGAVALVLALASRRREPATAESAAPESASSDGADD